MYIVRPSWFLKKVYPQAIWRKEGKSPSIYLTFDDGPIPEITTWVLDILSEKKIPATFFCVGENISRHADIFKKIVDGGHRVGNHTFNHLNGWDTSTGEYMNNVNLCETLLPNSNGDRLFRPPYGKMRKSQLKQLSCNYSIVMWDVLSGDFDKSTSPEKCLWNVCSYLRNGSVIVFHDNIKAKKNLEYTLPRFIDYALNKGFVFKTL